MPSNFVKVYHLSPHANIQRFRGHHSSKLHALGIFVSESWRSVLNDWIGTLLSKKFGGRKPATIEKRRRKLRRLEDWAKDPKLEEEYGEKARRYNTNNLGSYSSLTVYTLLIPRESFEQCKQEMHRLADEAFAKFGAGAIGGWGWGVETFIFEEFLNQIKIVGRKTYTKEEALELSEKHHHTTRTHRSNIYKKMEAYQQEIEKLIEVFGPAPLLDRARRYANKIESVDVVNASRHYKVIEDLIAPYKKQLHKRKRPNPDVLPVRAFHGTTKVFDNFSLEAERSSRFEAASVGIWFSDDFESASKFAHSSYVTYGPQIDPKTGDYYCWTDGELKRYGTDNYVVGNVLVCNLKLSNPKIYKTDDQSDSLEKMMNERDQFAQYIDKRRGTVSPGHWKKRMIAEDSETTNKLFREYLQKQGYDAIILEKTEWDKVKAPHTQIAVFYSSQITIESSVQPAPRDTSPDKRDYYF